MMSFRTFSTFFVKAFFLLKAQINVTNLDTINHQKRVWLNSKKKCNFTLHWRRSIILRSSHCHCPDILSSRNFLLVEFDIIMCWKVSIFFYSWALSSGVPWAPVNNKLVPLCFRISNPSVRHSHKCVKH